MSKRVKQLAISGKGLLIGIVLTVIIFAVAVEECIRRVSVATAPVPSPPSLPRSSSRSSALPALRNITVFSINEYADWPLLVKFAAGIDSQMLIRAWFKWREAHDYKREAYLIDMAHENGQLFCGGVTMSALYEGENGISLEEFSDMVTRDPHGRLFPAFGRSDAGYYHGSLANRRYLDYVLSFAYRQIDAGVDCLFMDEVNGAYTIHEGYDDYGIADFRDWVMRRFCDDEGWSLKDRRWTEELEIHLDNRVICPDATIASFDYRQYLQFHGWADDPGNGENPLATLWGNTPTSTGDDYTTYRNHKAWSYVSGKIREYALSKGTNVLITANGLNRFVDFQMRGVWEDWPVKHALPWQYRLDCSIPYLHKWRSDVLLGRELVDKDAPVVFFHDWGFGMPWNEIPVIDRINWLRIYVAEIYSAGAYFAFPVHGPYNDAKRDGTFEWIGYLSQFYLNYSNIYRSRSWLSPRQVSIVNRTTGKGGISVAFWEHEELQRRAIHLVNHRFQNYMLVPQHDLLLELPSASFPTRVYAISPSFEGERLLKFSMEADTIRIRLPELEDYVVILLDYEGLPEKGHLDDKTLLCSHQWRRPVMNRFSVPNSAAPLPKSGELIAFVQGKYHLDMKNNPVFLVDYSVDGQFVIHVNSVAKQGAVLVVCVDGVNVLEQALPDRDWMSGGYAWEYDREFAIPISAGEHEIEVDNIGSDWFSVDYYVLTDYVI